MQFIEQFLQKFNLPHSLIILAAFSELRPFLRFSVLPISMRVKKGQGKVMDALGFREIVDDAEEHLINLLNPPLDLNFK